MKKFFFSIILVVILVLLPATNSFSGDLPQNSDKTATTSVTNPYSAAMANYIADFVEKYGEKRIEQKGQKGKPWLNFSTLMLVCSDGLYFLKVFERNGKKSLIIHIGYFFAAPYPNMSIKDNGPTGEFSYFYPSGNIFIENKKLGDENAKAKGKPFRRQTDENGEAQKMYDSILSEIIGCLRCIEMHK